MGGLKAVSGHIEVPCISVGGAIKREKTIAAARSDPTCKKSRSLLLGNAWPFRFKYPINWLTMRQKNSSEGANMFTALLQ